MATSIPFGSRSTAYDVIAGIDLSGKSILLTGCNSGIGFETMRVLSAHGAEVIGLARTQEVAQAACSRAGSNNIAVECDLSNISSVVAAIDTVRKIGKPLDAIITNAGIAAPKELQVRYGVEIQFLVNHLSHFLLTTRLLDLIPDQSGRIVVGSSSSSINQIPKDGIAFSNLDGSASYDPFAFYGQSKLATALFAKELSQKLSGRGVAVNSLHPGATRGTNLNANLGFPLNAVLYVAQLFMKTVEQGAATQVLLAASPLVDGVTGGYWADCQVATGSVFLESKAMADRLWRFSEEFFARNLKL
jgi:WW domain-containing oxidoreductase